MYSRVIKAAAFAAAFFLAGPGHATSVDINPVRIDLMGPGQPAELRLTNTGNEELSVQIDTLQWAQGADGLDQLVETDQLLAVPPIFTIAPGEQQIVRIGYLGAPDPDQEMSFRLLVTELAGAPADENAGSSLAMRMRFSIPAFVAPVLVEARPEIVLQNVSADEDVTRVTIANTGNAHARLSRFEVLGSSGWELLPESMSIRYLLPGAMATVEIPPERGALSAIRISSIEGRDWEYAVRTPL